MIHGSYDDIYTSPVICSHSYWIYTDSGGLLTVIPQLTEKVLKNDPMAVMVDAFGTTIKSYFVPESGIVIGKSTQPASYSGARILHLGILKNSSAS